MDHQAIPFWASFVRTHFDLFKRRHGNLALLKPAVVDAVAIEAQDSGITFSSIREDSLDVTVPGLLQAAVATMFAATHNAAAEGSTFGRLAF